VIIRLKLFPLILLVFLAACAGRDRASDAPPAETYKTYYPVGFPGVRIIGTAPTETYSGEVDDFLKHGSIIRANGSGLDILALSSGGAEGAFGAGVLNGWTASGRRPEFDIVTGVSTGSLIAPFAFLGPEYDVNITRLYTETSTKDLIQPKFFSGIVNGQSLFNTTRLRNVIKRELTDDLIDRIGDEHLAGRRLYIATTHLDAAEAVTWDVGKIANYRSPAARKLVRDVLWASAAIPIAFTPVTFTVTDGRTTHTELHVDGGVTKEVFVYAPEVPMRSILRRLGLAQRKNRIWLIYNDKLLPEYEPQRTGLLSLATRTIETLVKAQSVGDIKEVGALAERDGLTLRVMPLPNSFVGKSQELFDITYMQALYKIGFELGKDPDNWSTSFQELFG
jgi:predicted patatin/cPLA2 family phospholipase